MELRWYSVCTSLIKTNHRPADLVCAPEGRWVLDDYDESKSLSEITPRGLQPGDLVGDLPDPQSTSTSTTIDAVSSNATASQSNQGGGLGIYRAGGPTTIFGSAGWGPFSDGPLNAVRKGFLNREGVKEENWMHLAAQRVREADQEFAKIRRHGVQPNGGVPRGSMFFGGGLYHPRRQEESVKANEEPPSGEAPRRRSKAAGSPYPLGVFEPHSGQVLCTSLSIHPSPFPSLFQLKTTRRLTTTSHRSFRHPAHPLPLGEHLHRTAMGEE